MHANSLVLDTITVRQHNGMFSLNDLHKAAGDSPNHRPGEFIRNQQTQELVAELSNAGISAFESRRGHSGGTYACRELVIAYAAWISAAFHLKVIRVFLAAQTAAAQPQASPAIDYDRISPAQQQDLQELVQLIVASGKQGYGETWRRFHNKFKVAKYDQLPSERFDDAVAYLKGKLDADALLQLVSRHLDARIPLIVESVSQMVGTLAQDAMKQLILSDNLVTTRYVSGFSHDRERGIAPAITPVRRDQNIMSVPEMLHELEGGWFGAKPDQVCNALTALSSQLVRMSRTPARA